jgi:hypothetical protein
MTKAGMGRLMRRLRSSGCGRRCETDSLVLEQGGSGLLSESLIEFFY